MLRKRPSTTAKRCALALLIGFMMQATAQTAHGQLVESSITDVNEVVPANALLLQDGPALAPPTPQSLPGGQATAPQISQPFANPLPNQPNNFPQPTGPAPNFGGGGGGLGLSASLGVTAGSYSSAPTMMGDFFGGSGTVVSGQAPVFTSFFSPGTIISGSGSSAILAFDFGSGTPNDIFSQSGTGVDVSGDLNVDTFDILEPVPPTDAPTSPGPGFVFGGGTATYTNSNGSTTAANGVFANNEIWYVQYSYVSNALVNGIDRIVLAGPDSATRRTKLSENFSPEVRDRLFFNYNFFNDTFGGLGDISRYVLGMERVLFEDLMSVEFRLPMAGTLASTQQADGTAVRDYELGNATVLGKVVLLRTDRFTLTGGCGMTIPLADDAKLMQGTTELLRIENEAVHFLPFLGILNRYNRKTFFQAYTQFDVDANGNTVFASPNNGGLLRGIGKYTDSTLAHVDASAHRIVYENRRPSSILNNVIANAELHYTGTLQQSDLVTGNGMTVSSLKNNFNILNATVGAHFVLSNKFVVTPGMSVPLRDGLDEQFDYEALLQVNYLR